MIFPNFHSIKSKLIFSFSLFTMIIVLVIVAFLWSESRNRHIEKVASKLDKINLDIKELMKTERDFVIYESINPEFHKTKQSSYLNESQKLLNNLKKEILSLDKQNFLLSQKLQDDAQGVSQDIVLLEGFFESYEEGILKRGFKDYGLVGKMRNYIHDIENIVALDLSKVLMIRRQEKDYFLRKEDKYIDKLKYAVEVLESNIKQKIGSQTLKSRALDKLTAYQDTFLDIVKLDKKLGLKGKRGLRQDITAKINLVERKIKTLHKNIRLRAESQKSYNRIILLIVVMGFLGIGLSLVFFMTKQLGKPIEVLSDSIRKVIETNFDKSTHIPKIKTKDEIGRVSRDVYKMLRKVHQRTEEVLKQKDRIEESKRTIELLSEIGQKITHELDINAIIEVVYSNVKILLEADLVGVGIYDEAEKVLSFYGGEKEVAHKGYVRLEHTHKLSVQCFTQSKEILIGDIERDYQKFASYLSFVDNKDTYKSLIFQPLLVNDKSVGVITVQHQEKDFYEAYHADILKSIALYTAIALDNAQVYKSLAQQKEELLVSEEELRQNAEEFKVVNEKLEESEQKFRKLIETNPVGIFIHNTTHFLYANPQCEKIFGYSKEDLLETNLQSIVHQDCQGEIVERIQQSHHTDYLLNRFESKIVTKKGKEKWLDLTLSNIEFEQEENALLVSVYDITEKKIASDQLQEASRIIEEKNKALEKQKSQIEQRNKDLSLIVEEVNQQAETIVKKNEDITASITYAQRIQDAILPRVHEIEEAFEDSFILFRPRDIVSGDFYWFLRKKYKTIIAAVDCTGHGIPGAFMSLIGNDLLNEIVTVRDITEPAKILEELKRSINEVLRQEETKNQDGMDIAICAIDNFPVEHRDILGSPKIKFSGANNPLIYMQNGEMTQIKGNKIIIGGFNPLEKKKDFTQHEIDISIPTTFYIFSDGYQDQFGGISKRKFMNRRLRELLHEIHQKPMVEQKEILNQRLEEWMAGQRQIDDVLIVGAKLS